MDSSSKGIDIDGHARGSPFLTMCRGILKDDYSFHMGSFCDFMGEGNSEMEESLTTILTIEKAKVLGRKKLWLETDCILVVKAFYDSNLVP